jgi:hypothetical protein
LARHKQQLNDFAQQYPDIHPIKINTPEEVMLSQSRQHQMAYEYLETIGWVTKEYLAAQSQGDQKITDQIYDEIKEVLKKEHAYQSGKIESWRTRYTKKQ